MGVRTHLTGAAVTAVIGVMLPAVAPAQAPRAGIVTTLRGTATVARDTAPTPAPLKFRDDVFVRDRINTGDESLARILLGGKAVVTIRERSQLTITETATTSTIEMTSGKIALSVDKTRVQPGESVEIKTPHAVAAIRGTIIVAEVDAPSASSAASSRFTLLTGLVDVTAIDPVTGQPAGAAVILRPLQALTATGSAGVAAPRPITRAEAEAVAAGFSVPIREPSSGANAKVVADQVEQATQHAATAAKERGQVKTNDGGDRAASSASTAAGGDRTTSGKGGGGSAAGGGSTTDGDGVNGSIGGGTTVGSLTSGGAPGGVTGGSTSSGGTLGGVTGGSTLGGTTGGGTLGGVTGAGTLGGLTGGGLGGGSSSGGGLVSSGGGGVGIGGGTGGGVGTGGGIGLGIGGGIGGGVGGGLGNPGGGSNGSGGGNIGGDAISGRRPRR